MGSVRSGRAAGRAAAILGAGLLLAWSDSAHGQAAPLGGPTWSPLGPEARSAREASTGPGCHFCTAWFPRWEVGAFGAGRNPAALAHEVGEPHAGFSLGRDARQGEYRSTLDPESTEETRALAAGWIPLEGRGGLAGSASYSEGTTGSGGRRIQLDPGIGSPWVVADSSLSGHQATRARLDAAGGWRLGRLGVGVSAGYQTVEAISVPSGTPRRSRAAMPAASLGGEWSFREGALRLGAFGRWSASQVTTHVVGAPTPGLVTRLNGYAAPTLTTLAPGMGIVYYRRSEGESFAGGMTVAGRWQGWALAAWSEAGGTTEWSWSRQAADPPRDHWETRGWEVGGEARGQAAGGEVLARVRGASFHGRARLANADSLIYLATETVIGARVEGRWPLASNDRAWLAVALGAELADRDRGDTIPNTLRTQVETLVTAAQVEASFQFRDGVHLLGGYGMARSDARGRLPRVQSLPPRARPILGPEVAMAGTPWLQHLPWLGLQWDFRPGTSALARGAFHSMQPGGTARLQDTPGGSRGGWSLELGFVLR
jgi:hypothetical protein